MLAISHLEAIGHEYAELFRLLPAASQTEILEKAGQRVGPTKLASDHEAILAEFGTNFVLLRYPYEKYLHMSEAEFRVHSDKWAATPGGADEGTADFRFHPEELRGMLFALSELAAGRI